MKWCWCYTCVKCGKEIASSDRLDIDFKRAEWIYDAETRTWKCPDCAAQAKKEGDA